MKKILSFLSYHNAIPLAAVVLALGAGSAFAAMNAGLLPLPSLIMSPVGSVIPTATESNEVDPSTLLSANLDTFDFRPTVTGVVETDSLYTVSYSISTLAPEGGAWVTYTKTGEFSIAKDTLADGGLNAYVVGKLHDIENGERSYLVRAQTAEKALANARTARPANAFAALVGLALDQIFVPVVAKPAPDPQPQTPPVQPTPTPSETVVLAPAPTPEPMATSTPTATSTPVVPEPAPVATTTPVATSTPTQTEASTPNTATSTPESIATSTPTQPPESTSTTGTASSTQSQ